MPVVSTPLSMSFTQTSKPHHHLHYNHHQGSDFFLPSLSHSRTNSHDSSLLRMNPHHRRVPQHDPSRPLPRVAILWDFQSCRPTAQIPASAVTGNIVQACLHYGSITLFKAYVERPAPDSQPQHQPHHHQRSPAMTQDLHDCGVQISYYTPLYRSSSIPYIMGTRTPFPSVSGPVSDTGSVSSSNLSSAAISSQLLTDLFLFALDNPAPNTVIVLITADEISPHAISALRQRHYTIVLIMPRSAVDGQPLRANMAAQADEVLDWTAVMRGAFSSSRQSSGHTGLGGDHTPTTTVFGGGSALGRDVDAGSAPSEGDLDPVGNTPTGDDNISPIGGNEAIPRVSSPTSLTSFNASTTSPTARRTTPAETVSSGGTVVDAPSFGEGGGIGDIHHAIGEDNSTSHLSSSNRHESRDILGSARPTMDMPPFGQQNVLTNPDSLPAAGTANTTTMGSHSNVNVHAQPFQPFRTHSAGLGTTNVGSAFTPRPYPPSGGIPRVWSHFPAGPTGLGSPLFPARTLSGSTTISSGNQKHGATASTEGIAPALTSLNTNVSSQGPNAGPTSAVSTTSSLASPTPSSNWTQSPPLRAPMPAPQRQGSSVFGQISNLGAGGNNPNTASTIGSANERTGISSAPSVSSVSSVSPTESVVRRPAFVHHSSYQSQTHSGGAGAGTGAGFGRNTSIGFGSSGGFGLATTTSPTLTRELNRESQSRSQTMQGHVQSPSMASALMSPPPPPTMPLHRQQQQQQQQQQQRQDSIVQLQQSGLAHQHSFHGLPQQQQQQQQMPQQPQHASPYGNPHVVVAPNLPRRGYSDQFNFGPGQGIHGSHTGSIRDVGPEGGRGILQPSGGYQTHRQTLGGSIGSGVGMPHPYGPHSQNPNVMSNISLPPTSRPISPRHFSLLLNILREFRADGKLRPYRSKIGSELVQRDRMVYQRAGVGGFKEYVGQAEQMGYVRLGGHSGSPGKEWIELVVNE